MDEKTPDQNLAILLSEKTAEFLQPAESSDAELVRAAVEFTLEISPEQNYILLVLEMLAIDSDVKENERKKIKTFVDNFLSRKRYHDTKHYLVDIIKSLSWRHFVESGYVTGSVSKTEMK